MPISSKSFDEAMRRTFGDFNADRDGNLLRLDCDHVIFADPRWNEIALASAIEEHKRRHHQED